MEYYSHITNIFSNNFQKEAEGIEETLTSTEFDKFLEERAAAAENLPNVTAAAAANNNAAVVGDSQRKPTKPKPEEEDLLKL